ncbi:uncharacterized protein IWZ02DRAFT_466602 [Phyllosticta citriasiana]|uniref:uncharacterized protein n=1 Tax=Phyllosticta citriasiana TaxID=595635 RepID=UPI0030FDCACC
MSLCLSFALIAHLSVLSPDYDGADNNDIDDSLTVCLSACMMHLQRVCPYPPTRQLGGSLCLTPPPSLSTQLDGSTLSFSLSVARQAEAEAERERERERERDIKTYLTMKGREESG